MRRMGAFPLLSGLAMAVASSAMLQAKPVTPEQMQKAVLHFSKKKASSTEKVEAAGKPGQPKKTLYYLSHLEGGGYVVAAPDDELTPVIAFAKKGKLVLKEGHPLKKMLDMDMANRLKKIGDKTLATDAELLDMSANQRLWEDMIQGQEGGEWERGIAQLDDIRVDPLLATQWSQSTTDSLDTGVKVYNLFTPKNYMCGCVAVALAQFLRYHQWPSQGIGQKEFTVTVDGASQTLTTRGGDGEGGPYNWSRMIALPSAGVTDAQAQMIGSLTYDAGLAVKMNYGATASWANVFDCAGALRNLFKYSNAIGWEDPTGSAFNEDGFDSTLNANLDAGNPILFGLSGDSGHAVVCDGYGFHTGKPYHHINMGWADAQDVWYNLPIVDGKSMYSYFKSIVYNVYKEGKGEIVSGRVLNNTKAPIDGAQVILTDFKTGEQVATATTNARGIYFFKNVPSAKPYNVTATKEGWTFPTVKVPVGTSKDSNADQMFGLTANKWGQELRGATSSAAPQITAQPQSVTIQEGESTTLTVTASGAGLRYAWYQGEIGDTSTPVGQNSYTFQTPVLTETTAYWVRVTAQNGAFVDSDPATVTVTATVGPQIITQPQDVTILPGQTATLNVIAKGKKMVFDWYRGESGDTAHLVKKNGGDTFITPTLNESVVYWVRITDGDGHRIDSRAATVTVEEENSEGPKILTQPKSVTIKSGQSATLTVVAKGKGMRYDWYVGQSGDTSHVAKQNGQDTYITPALKATTSYWVRITDRDDASVDSKTAVVKVRK